MAKNNFKAILPGVTMAETGTTRLWQIRSDRRNGVITVSFDENARPNRIAGLARVQKPQNHYCFLLNKQILQDAFSETAQMMVADHLMPKLIEEAEAEKFDSLLIYPATGQERHIDWIREAFSRESQAHGVSVSEAVVQLAEKKTVPAIELKIKA